MGVALVVDFFAMTFLAAACSLNIVAVSLWVHQLSTWNAWSKLSRDSIHGDAGPWSERWLLLWWEPTYFSGQPRLCKELPLSVGGRQAFKQHFVLWYCICQVFSLQGRHTCSIRTRLHADGHQDLRSCDPSQIYCLPPMQRRAWPLTAVGRIPRLPRTVYGYMLMMTIDDSPFSWFLFIVYLGLSISWKAWKSTGFRLQSISRFWDLNHCWRHISVYTEKHGSE